MLNYMMGQDENAVWAKCAICRGWGTDCSAGCITKEQKVNQMGLVSEMCRILLLRELMEVARLKKDN